MVSGPAHYRVLARIQFSFLVFFLLFGVKASFTRQVKYMYKQNNRRIQKFNQIVLQWSDSTLAVANIYGKLKQLQAVQGKHNAKGVVLAAKHDQCMKISNSANHTYISICTRSHFMKL